MFQRALNKVQSLEKQLLYWILLEYSSWLQMNFSLVLLASFFALVILCHLDLAEAGKKDDSVVVINNGKGKVYYEDDGDKKKKKKKKGKSLVVI